MPVFLPKLNWITYSDGQKFLKIIRNSEKLIRLSRIEQTENEEEIKTENDL